MGETLKGGKVRGRRKRENLRRKGQKEEGRKRVFSLENRVDLRLSMENGKSVCMCVCMYVSHVCIYMHVPVVRRYT